MDTPYISSYSLENATFQPQVNAVSRNLNIESLCHRYTEVLAKKKENIELITKEVDEQLKNEHTFQPQLAPMTKYLITNRVPLRLRK